MRQTIPVNEASMDCIFVSLYNGFLKNLITEKKGKSIWQNVSIVVAGMSVRRAQKALTESVSLLIPAGVAIAAAEDLAVRRAQEARTGIVLFLPPLGDVAIAAAEISGHLAQGALTASVLLCSINRLVINLLSYLFDFHVKRMECSRGDRLL